MEKKVSLADLAGRLSELNHLSPDQGNDFVARFFEVLENGLLRENMVKIKGFGTFKIVEVADRESIDVNTGERILIQGHSKLSFIPDVEMRDKVNRPFVAFEPIVLNEGTDEEEMAFIPEDSIEAEIDDEDLELQAERIQTPVSESIGEKPVSEPVSEKQGATIEESPAEDTSCEDTTDEKTAVPEAVETVEPVLFVPENTIEPQPVAEDATKPVVDVSENAEMKEGKKSEDRFQWGYLLYALLTIALMGGSYYAGYYRLLCPCVDCQKNEVVSEKVGDTPKEEPVPQDTVVAQPPKKVEPPVEDQYPQVPGGAYLIVGVQSVHKMAVGDNLYKIARKEYGDNDFARYIIVLNQFKDPDKIPLGYNVKLPKLRPNK